MIYKKRTLGDLKGDMGSRDYLEHFIQYEDKYFYIDILYIFIYLDIFKYSYLKYSFLNLQIHLKTSLEYTCQSNTE